LNSLQTPNGKRYLRVGGRGQNFESRILPGQRKSLKMPQNPTRQVHAVLGGVFHHLILIWKGNSTLLYFKYAEIKIDALNEVKTI